MILCAIVIMFTVASKKSADDGAVTVFGYQFRTVLTGSMEATEELDVSAYDIQSIPTGSLVVVKVAPENPTQLKAWFDNDVKVGDVLTFRYITAGIKQDTITHRVIGKEPVEGGYLISLQGDNRSKTSHPGVQTIDTTKQSTTGNYIIGEVVASSNVAGAITNFVKSPKGIIFLIMVPCFFIIVFEVIKILKIAKEDKKESVEKATADKDGEIEELRRELEALREKAAQQNASAAETAAAEAATEAANETEAQNVQTQASDSAEITDNSEN